MESNETNTIENVKNAIFQQDPQEEILTPEKKKCKFQRKKLRRLTLHRYIYNLLRTLKPDITISQNAMEVMNSMIIDMFKQISEEAGRLIKYNQRKTLFARDIKAAAALIFPRKIAEDANSYASRRCIQFSQQGKFFETQKF